MPDEQVPREAIERLKTWVVLPADQYEQATAEIVGAALPFLRAQWEADLLSDEAIERVLAGVPTTATGGWIGRVTVERVLEAALGSRFVPEEPKDAP